MIRALHRWPGLLALALVTVLAFSGAMLSIFPVAERLAAPQAAAGLTVAELAACTQTAYPGLEQIRRAPSGRITAAPGSDPASLRAALQAATDEVDAQMSTWKPDSDLMHINATPPEVWVNVPLSLMVVLDSALEIGRASGGRI